MVICYTWIDLKKLLPVEAKKMKKKKMKKTKKLKNSKKEKNSKKKN